MADTKNRRKHSQIVPFPQGGKAESAEQDATDPALRKTGISFLSDVPWGAHLCMFYESKEDLLDMLASYFMAGLESNEFCLWAVSDPITMTDAKDYLRGAISKFDDHLSA